MNKPNAIVTHRDDKSYYAADRKSARLLRKRERYEARNERRSQRRSEKAQKKRAWQIQKRDLYNYAHSLDFYEQADLHLSNTRRYHTHNDVLKFQNKLRNREYKRLVRLNKKFL